MKKVHKLICDYDERKKFPCNFQYLNITGRSVNTIRVVEAID